MNIIAQTFKKLSSVAIKSLKRHEIKSILHRKRLKFSYQEMIDYVQIIFEHSFTQKTFKSLYKKSNVKVNYSTFMNNISLFSKLFKYLFVAMNKKLSILPSKFLNIVDTSLISEKQTTFINQKDWNSGRVTTRKNKNNVNNYVCGSKALIFINRQSKIYHAELLNINFSDQNILKNFTKYLSQLKGILLADRGFSNKAVRERISSLNVQNLFHDIFNKTNKPTCRLISPYHYKEKIKLTTKERKLYKRRWRIETLFQRLKHNYSESKLNLTGKYSKNLKTAKFYSSLIIYNLLPQ